MAIIHRIGTPENDSEARAIKRFAKDLPNSCFVFHNFELTTGRGLPYEYDMHVPQLYFGVGVPKGVARKENVGVDDIAPTLSGLLGLPPPAQSVGKKLF